MLLDPEVLYGFTATILSSRFDDPKPTPAFHKQMWEYCCQDDPRVAIAAPRGHAKSTALTHSFTLACLCFRIKTHVLLVSDTEAQAINFLRDIKTEFTENEEMIKIFGFSKILKDREAEFVGEFEDGHQVRVIAKGSEQKVRGIKWRNKRPDLIVCDDLENDDIVMNEERRYKFRRWFTNALLPCGSRKSHIRVVGTILHTDALLQRLVPNELDPQAVDDGIKLTTTRKGEWLSILFRAHNSDFSKVLWPDQYSEEDLRSLRQTAIEQGLPEGYAQEYLNKALDEATAFFKKRDFQCLTEPEGPEEFYIAVDMAISERKKRAFTVFAVGAMAADGKLRIRDIIRFRGDSLDIINEMFRLQNIYSPEAFFVEQENIARALGPVLDREMRERGVYLMIEQMQASQDKVKRAGPLQARMRTGMVQFDMDSDWFGDLQQEFLQFPRGAFKDQVDATAWLPLGLNKIGDVRTQKEYDEDAYNDELIETSTSFSGVSTITGY